jgi:hypothetical protein
MNQGQHEHICAANPKHSGYRIVDKMVVFLFALLFVFQFVSGAVLQFAQGTDEKQVTVHRVAGPLCYDEVSTGEKGVTTLSCL